MSELLLQAKEVYKRHAGTTTDTVQDVNLSVQAGEYVAIMGKSGSGKSTLLHLLAGFDRPTQGEVWFEQDRLSHMRESALAAFRRQKMGFIHQFFNLIDSMTALENAMLPALLMGMRYRDARQRCRELFADLGIAGLETKVPESLSGGQKQRIAIARALVNRPRLILADEPTGSLDTQTGEAVLRLFRDLQESSYAIVMVTHDPKVASQADRVLFMQDGQLVDETVLTEGSTAASLISKVLGVL